MPYIKNEQKKRLAITGVVGSSGSGDLNYLISKLLIEFTERFGVRYSTFNDVIGALECAKQEYLRRVVAVYEDQKIKENGDVYPTSLTSIPDKECR